MDAVARRLRPLARALGTAEQIAQTLQTFYEAGVRYVILDLVGPYEERLDHLAAFADEVLPLI